MKIFVTFLVLAPCVTAAHAQERLPIIDMHLHAMAADAQGPPPVAMCTPFVEFPAWDPSRPYSNVFLAMLKQPQCDHPVWSPETDEEIMRQTIEVMERRNVVGVLSGSPDRVAVWRKAAPERFIPGLQFMLDRDGVSPDSIRQLHARGDVAVLGEITNAYAGIAPDDERMEPFWAVAEELDLPIGIHIGAGPPGVAYFGGGYRARLNSALTLEEMLVRHSGLRVYVMHAGFPMLDDLLAVLYVHPQVHVDVSLIIYAHPRAEFYRFLEGIVNAGFGNRVMFGSDQMVWPEVIERAIAVIEEAPFLSQEQKRDILYDNAARFLRLSEDEIARHHKM